MRDPIKGVLAMVVACTIWGLSPLFWALLSHVPSTLVIGYRTLWSLMFFAAVLAAQGRLGLLLGAVRNPRSFLIILAAGVMIASNWLTFISAIHNGRGVEASSLSSSYSWEVGVSPAMLGGSLDCSPPTAHHEQPPGS